MSTTRRRRPHAWAGRLEGIPCKVSCVEEGSRQALRKYAGSRQCANVGSCYGTLFWTLPCGGHFRGEGRAQTLSASHRHVRGVYILYTQ